MRLLLTSALILLVAIGTAIAADITGKWNGEVQGRGGQTRPVTFNLKQDGGQLTGSMVGPQGRELPIADGKVSGDQVSFTVTMEFNGNTVKTNYTGTVSGDEIKMKSQREGGDSTQEFTAKRSK